MLSLYSVLMFKEYIVFLLILAVVFSKVNARHVPGVLCYMKFIGFGIILVLS